MKLQGKTALITGGSSGIGEAISKLFSQNGAEVIIIDLQKPKEKFHFFQVDITNEQQVQQAISKIPKLDILVNNAGIYFQSPIEETEESELYKILAVNLKAPYILCKHALPLLKKSQGSIINVASCLGVVPEPEASAYCMTKAGLIMLTKCLSQTYASDNVRVNAILPGPIDTPLLRNYFSSQEEFESYQSSKPMKRVGKPEEVAQVALFLASSDAGFVNGGMYSVDGGESASSIYSK